MASPGELVQVMSNVLGIPKATITQYDRILAENGLRSMAGRGRSAARVSPQDAAHLLIAVASNFPSGTFARDAASICKKFSSLTSVPLGGPKRNFGRLGVTALDSLPDGHSFGEALSALIDFASREGFYLAPRGLKVEFLGPEPLAFIIAAEGSVAAKLFYREKRKHKDLFVGDLLYSSTIGYPTIDALGQLLSGGL